MTGRTDIRQYLREGDIDFFFETTRAVDRNLLKIQSIDDKMRSGPSVYRTGNVLESFGRWAYDIPVEIEFIGDPIYTKLQFIKFNHGDQVSTLESFDLLASRVAFNSTHVWIDDRLLEMWDRKQIVILKGHEAKFLTSRLRKYVTRHLYENGLSEESRPIFLKWMMQKCNNPESLKQIVSLARSCNNVILDEDLILLLGKHKLLPSPIGGPFAASIKYEDDYGDFVFQALRTRAEARAT